MHYTIKYKNITIFWPPKFISKQLCKTLSTLRLFYNYSSCSIPFCCNIIELIIYYLLSDLLLIVSNLRCTF